MPRILVTNDDGVHSEGIKALASALAPLGDVTVVAPIQEASAIGHALTLRRPLRIDAIGPNVYAIDGTPTDCVNLAITHVLKGKPDLIVSGINKGWNLGDDVTYSGTVSGALEGALLEIHSIAVSTQRVKDECEFGPSADAAAIVAQAVLEQGLPKFTLLIPPQTSPPLPLRSSPRCAAGASCCYAATAAVRPTASTSPPSSPGGSARRRAGVWPRWR